MKDKVVIEIEYDRYQEYLRELAVFNEITKVSNLFSKLSIASFCASFFFIYIFKDLNLTFACLLFGFILLVIGNFLRRRQANKISLFTKDFSPNSIED